MTFQILQGWALVALAITGPPSLAYLLVRITHAGYFDDEGVEEAMRWESQN